MTPSQRRALAGWHLALPLALAPLIWWLFDISDLDRWLISPYYDVASRAFPLRDDAFMTSVMHSGMKLVAVAIGIAVFGAYLLTYVMPQLRHHRRRFLWLFVGMVGATTLVSVLKHNSALHCPWDLAEYGGYAPFHALFDTLPENAAPGRCFPSGHASGGFAMIAFYFALRDFDSAKARLMLAVGIALGTVMGWTQMMRGAHFLSHTVWSAWVEWMFLAGFYYLLPPEPRQPLPA